MIRGTKRSAAWPLYRPFVPSGPTYWDDLDALRAELIGAFEAEWQTLAPAIDEAFARIDSVESGA